jgi:MFS family permease
LRGIGACVFLPVHTIFTSRHILSTRERRSSTAFYLISAINASSFFGRILPGYLSDRYGHFNIYTLSVLTSGIIGFTWSAAYNLPGMVIWCIAYGFTSGVSLEPISGRPYAMKRG